MLKEETSVNGRGRKRREGRSRRGNKRSNKLVKSPIEKGTRE